MAEPDSARVASSATTTAAAATQVVVVTVGSRTCAIPIRSVRETMRPLPIERVAGVPQFILGLSVIRGAAVPVVSLGALLSDRTSSAAPSRFVTLELAGRSVALAVDGVVGVRHLDATMLEQMPALLQDADNQLVDALATKDEQLLVVLHTARLIPAAVWDTLGAAGSA